VQIKHKVFKLFLKYKHECMKTFEKETFEESFIKAQSAMEYLMTYGWAILIIAVVLGALFELGVFNGMTFAPKAQPGSCQVSRPYGPGTTSFINLEGICTGEIPQFVAQFNGQSSYISGSTANLPLGSSAGSAFAWVYINAYPTSSNAVIEDYGVATTAEGRGLYITTTGNLCFTGWADDYCSSFTVPLNTWTFVGYAYAGGTNTIVYMNGLGGSGSVSTTLNTQSGLNLIGKRLDNAAPYISGEISNVQIYNTSFSANNTQALYLEGIGGAPIYLQTLVGWWPLNGNTNDYSGDGNNGASTNVIYVSNWYSGYTPP
jgi:hypothetical protein